MTVKLLNCSVYANIYGVIENGQTVGTIELKLAGREAGKAFTQTWSSKHTRRDIRKAWTDYRKHNR